MALTPTTYRVRGGDTLWHIAKKELGDPLRWGDIAEMNRLRNPDLIHPGQELLLPRMR